MNDKAKRRPKAQEGRALSARQMFERQWLSEGRDDLSDRSKVNVEPETRGYARMTSKDVMDQPGGTAKKWTKSLELRKAITNQRGLKGFTDMDKSENTGGGKLKESPAGVVRRMLEL